MHQTKLRRNQCDCDEFLYGCGIPCRHLIRAGAPMANALMGKRQPRSPTTTAAAA